MAAFPTLSTNPDYPLDPDGVIDDVVIRNQTTGGYEITRPRTTRARRSWGVTYSTMKDSDVATLRDFERVTLKNGADSFTWSHPLTGTSYSVRLASPISYQLVRYNISNVSLSLKEV